MKKLLLLMVVFLCAGMASAVDTTWTDGATDPDDHLWSTPENWDTGVLPTLADWSKVRNGPPGATIASEGAVALKCHIGYEDGSALTVDGGTLTTPADDLLTGRNSGAGTLNMISGVINVGKDFEVGDTGSGTFNMTGGTINVTRDMKIPNSAGATAEVNMTGGSIIITDDLAMAVACDGVLNLDGGTIFIDDDLQMAATGCSIDIKFGTLTIDGDASTTVQGYIDNEWITGFGIAGNVTWEIVDGDTVVTATDPMQRIPAYGAEVNTAVSSDVDLSWLNLDPNEVDGNVWVDVWFGTDVDALTLEVDAGMDVTSVTVSAPGTLQEYFWQIVTYRYGDPADGQYNYGDDPDVDGYSVDVGIVMHFTVSDDFPPTIVMNTPRTVTWVGQPLLIEATVTDEGTSDVTVTWDTSINSDPNEEYSDPVTVLPAGTTYPVVVSTYLTVDFDKGSFGMRANAADSAGNNWSEEVHHQCRADACAAAIFWWQQNGGVPQGELNADCAIDLGDLLLLVNEWLDDYTILVPTPIAP